MPFIVSVLKPFDNSKIEKQSIIAKKKTKRSLLHMSSSSGSSSASANTPQKPALSYFQESILRFQSEFVNIDTLLNPNLSKLPFKSYFEVLYKFCVIFNKLDYIIDEFDELGQSKIQQCLVNAMFQTNQLNNFVNPSKEVSANPSNRRTSSFNQRTQTGSILFPADEETQSKWSREDALNFSELNEEMKNLAQTVKSRNFDFDSATKDQNFKQEDANTNQNVEIAETEVDKNPITLEAMNTMLEPSDDIKIELIYEQKFYLSLFYIPNLMFNMSDPKKNQLAQSICMVNNESFELILPYLINLFENPNTCVNSFLFLFNKVAKFLSRSELLKRFLPQIIHVLNVVDLNETIGIDLNNKDNEKVRFCKLFDFPFMNELRITFGLHVFLTQICPFLIEAISGFKDLEYESDSGSTAANQTSSLSKNELKSQSSLNKLSTDAVAKEAETFTQTKTLDPNLNKKKIAYFFLLLVFF